MNKAPDSLVDQVIVQTVVPQLYGLVDRLVEALGDKCPKDLRVEAGRALPPQYKHSFSAPKKS